MFDLISITLTIVIYASVESGLLKTGFSSSVSTQSICDTVYPVAGRIIYSPLFAIIIDKMLS